MNVLNKISNYFAKEYNGNDSASPKLEMSVKELREIANIHKEKCRAEHMLKIYQRIGTVEECRKAVAKQKLFTPETTKLTVGIGRCKCGAEFLDSTTNFCGNCGQKLNWD